MICSRDWQEHLEIQERIAVALETIASTITDEAFLKTATTELMKHNKELSDALKGSAPPPA